MTRFGLIRDIILLVNGLGLLWYQAIFENFDRPWMILAGITLTGATVFLPSGIAETLGLNGKGGSQK